jgi:hypothetical protein
MIVFLYISKKKVFELASSHKFITHNHHRSIGEAEKKKQRNKTNTVIKIANRRKFFIVLARIYQLTFLKLCLDTIE